MREERRERKDRRFLTLRFSLFALHEVFSVVRSLIIPINHIGGSYEE